MYLNQFIWTITEKNTFLFFASEKNTGCQKNSYPGELVLVKTKPIF